MSAPLTRDAFAPSFSVWSCSQSPSAGYLPEQSLHWQEALSQLWHTADIGLSVSVFAWLLSVGRSDDTSPECYS